MFPVRCYTCNAVLAQMHPTYRTRTAAGDAPYEVLESLRVTRLCCRRMFLGHVDLTADQLRYPNADLVLDEGSTVLRRRVRAEHCVSCA